jgi:hypothetical protein
MSSIPYPPMDQDDQLLRETQRAERAREALDPSNVLAVVQHLLLEIADDTQNPLWSLVQSCTRTGTASETGKTPHLTEQVGAAFLPLIDQAITRLVDERLADFNAWGRD